MVFILLMFYYFYTQKHFYPELFKVSYTSFYWILYT